MNYTDIKTYEDALNVLKEHGVIGSNYIEPMVKCSKNDNEFRNMGIISKSLEATFKLSMVCKAINLLTEYEYPYMNIPEIQILEEEKWTGTGFHVDIEGIGKREIVAAPHACNVVTDIKYCYIGMQGAAFVNTKEAAIHVATYFGNLIFDSQYADVYNYKYI